MGELLKQFDARPDNSRKQSEGNHTLPSQTEEARSAGISKHQQTQAVRVANVPEETFDTEINKAKPISSSTATALDRKKFNVGRSLHWQRMGNRHSLYTP
ncbi:hypothetical protein [Bradyrhizobium macuxiense]|uniref:hypothetical protein n=1 Tax=Bradyrhizobium macuxiense TaxID=1755647 RepID=UPI000AB19E2D|nr:hypothetical protein [Bradyrhizobium macuxiense]